MDDDCNGASKANMGTPVAGEANMANRLSRASKVFEYWPGHFAAEPLVKHLGASHANLNSDSRSLTTWLAFAHCHLQGWSQKPPFCCLFFGVATHHKPTLNYP